MTVTRCPPAVAEHLIAQHSAIKMLHSRVRLILEYVRAAEAGGWHRGGPQGHGGGAGGFGVTPRDLGSPKGLGCPQGIGVALRNFGVSPRNPNVPRGLGWPPGTWGVPEGLWGVPKGFRWS